MAEETKPPESQTTEFAIIEKGKEAQFVKRCYDQWNDFYNTNEKERAKRNYDHFRNESDILEARKLDQIASGKTRSTYYIPYLNPVIQTRVANQLDAVVRNDPVIAFQPVGPANLDSVRKQEQYVNKKLEESGFLEKLVERLTDKEIYPYAVCKVFLEEVTRKVPGKEFRGNVALTNPMTGEKRMVTIEDIKNVYRQFTSGQEMPDDELRNLIDVEADFVDEVIEIRPNHDNVPNGRFVYDPNVRDRQYRVFEGDINMVSYQYLVERKSQWDEKKWRRFETLHRNNQTAGTFDDYAWEREFEQAKEATVKDQPFALIELYARVVEDTKDANGKRTSTVVIKVFTGILNFPDPDSPESGDVFLLKEPHVSPYKLVDFPYSMVWNFKVPHTMLGISTCDNGVEIAEWLIDLWNLANDQGLWTAFNMLAVRSDVTFKNKPKVEPGHVLFASEIGEDAIRPIAYGSQYATDLFNLIAKGEERFDNAVAAADVLQGLAPDSGEKLGTTKMRRESSVTRMNLTGLLLGKHLCEIATMYRDLAAQQMMKDGKQTLYLGKEALQITASDLLERSSAEIVNIMRLASFADELVKMKEIYASLLQNPLFTQRIQMGDLQGVYDLTMEYLNTYRFKQAKQVMGERPAPPPPPPPTDEPAVDPITGLPVGGEQPTAEQVPEQPMPQGVM